MFEIFVYSPSMEGIHLRAGKVARGGIRWSDRREDFRTEILGLMKAQNVKNVVIVPMGSKGGFVVKNPSSRSRRRFRRKASPRTRRCCAACSTSPTTCAATTSIPPRDVVRRDADDPYLVVAADKGTATFSDIANAISAEYGFWLGDAFASGGCAGYDHKAMGITARGGWEAVKRHFRELGIDTQTRGLHRRRRRRHVGRRLRQRDAALAAHQAARGVQPLAHLRRSGSRSGRRASPSGSGCSISA